MKIILAIKTLTAAGGAERVFCTIGSELAARGHEVIVVSFDRPGSQAFYQLDARIRRIDLGIGNVTRTARLFETLRRMIALRKTVVAIKPDVAVGFMHSMFVPLALGLAGSGVPVVGSEHIVPDHYRTRPVQYLLLLASATFLSTITVLSETILRRYPRLIRKKMVAVPNPVLNACGHATPGREKQLYRLLSVGRLDGQKDHITLIQAFASISCEFPAWRLRIIGEGPKRSELIASIKGLGVEERVSLPGITRDIGAEYREADCFVLSSRYESFGLATAEAMSYGLPVIGFADCPGTNEIVKDKHSGLLVKAGPDRANSLANELRLLMADSSLRKRLGEAGRLQVGSLTSQEMIGNLWEELLERSIINSARTER